MFSGLVTGGCIFKGVIGSSIVLVDLVKVQCMLQHISNHQVSMQNHSRRNHCCDVCFRLQHEPIKPTILTSLMEKYVY